MVQNHGKAVTALVGRALKAAGDIARSVQMLNCIAVCMPYDNLLLKAHNQLFIKPFEDLAR